MKRYLPLTLIVVLFIAFRFIGAALPDSQPNFQPLAALFLRQAGGGLRFLSESGRSPTRLRWVRSEISRFF
jgi:hypothetical protein